MSMEVDACRFSRIAENASASLGNLLTNQTISANAIIGSFNTAFEWLAEHEVPEEEQVIFVNPAVMTQIRNTTELTKFLTQENYRAESGIDFTVEKYGGRPIIVVPSNRFFTNVLAGQNGFGPQASSYVINFMVVSTKAVVPIRKLEWNKVYGPELSGLAGFHGYLIDYLIYHDLFVPENKVPGVYVNVSGVGAGTKVNTLAIDTQANTISHAWKVKRYFTVPAGLRGYLIAMYDNPTLGTNVSTLTKVTAASGIATGKYMEIPLNTDIADSASASYYFALVDAAGNIIAKTGSVSLSN